MTQSINRDEFKRFFMCVSRAALSVDLFFHHLLGRRAIEKFKTNSK
jgi:hypothetical protein